MSTAAEVRWMPRDEQDKLRSLFENAPLWVAQCRVSGTLISWNPALEQAVAEGMGAPKVSLFELVDPRDRATVKRLLEEIFGGVQETVQFESRSPVNNKAMRWVLWSVPGANGKPGVAMALAEEKGEGTGSEAHLSRSHGLEVMGRLAGGIAHDFNNLLTGMLLYCDLLLNALESRHRARKYAEEVRNAATQAVGIVRQLLSAARPSNATTARLSLNEIAENLRGLLARLVGENIELDLQLDPDLGQVRIDAPQAQQVLMNLVLNARDAMPRGGRITVETRNCQVQILGETSAPPGVLTALPCALLVVSDNGTGIDEETRSHLFEAFFTTKGAKGTGLGLATVQDIVRSNGGLIHVHSAPGCGTRVSVLLPLVGDEVSILQDRKTLSDTEEFNPPFIKEKQSI